MNELFHRCFPGQPCQATDYQRLVAERLPTVGKLLDLGCGDNARMESHRTSDLEVWGTDFAIHPNLKHADWFRPLFPDGRIPFDDDTFDLVCSFMVMEHVAEPARFLAEIARVLKPGGVYVGHSIHAWHYVTWIRRLFDVVPHAWVQRLVKKLYGREEHDTFPTCYRMNSERALRHAASAAQLKWAAWHGYANQGYFVFSPWTFRSAILFDWSLEKVHAGLGKIYFTVVLRKPVAMIVPKLAA